MIRFHAEFCPTVAGIIWRVEGLLVNPVANPRNERISTWRLETVMMRRVPISQGKVSENSTRSARRRYVKARR